MEPDNEGFNENERDVLVDADERMEDGDNNVNNEHVDAAELDPQRQAFHQLLGRLRQGLPSLRLTGRANDMLLVLENMDEFCSFLHHNNTGSITTIYFPHTRNGEQPFEYTERNAAVWDKLLDVLKTMVSLEYVYIGGSLFSAELVSKLLQATPRRAVFFISVPFKTTTAEAEELSHLVSVVASHPLKNIGIRFGGSSSAMRSENVVKSFELLWKLCAFNSICILWIDYVQFTVDDCQELGNALPLNVSNIQRFTISNCSFVDGAEQDFLDMIGANMKALQSIAVVNCPQLCNGLPRFVARYPSVKNVCISVDKDDVEEVADFDLVKLVTEFARNNATAHLSFRGVSLEPEDTLKIQEVLKTNFTLEQIAFDDVEEPFRAITRLNKAGRRYLETNDGSTDTERCIEVLDKVKDDLDCLYFHLRENPILCITAAAQSNVE